MCDDCEINNIMLVEYLMFPGVHLFSENSVVEIKIQKKKVVWFCRSVSLRPP